MSVYRLFLSLAVWLALCVPSSVRAKVIFITSGATFTVPADFSSLTSIFAVGAGGDGGNFVGPAGASAGGGGASSTITSVTGIAANTVYNIQIGAHAGSTGSGTSPTANTWFKDGSTLVAAGGNTASGFTIGAGGAVADSVGTTKFAGGDGGSFTGGAGSGGGGGAGGTTAAGTVGQDAGGSDGTGGAGGTVNGGSGGAAGGGAGNPGTTFTATAGGTAGAGGGGGGNNGPSGSVGGAGGNYGAGGGGAGGSGPTTGGAGADGFIVFTYVATVGGVNCTRLLMGAGRC